MVAVARVAKGLTWLAGCIFNPSMLVSPMSSSGHPCDPGVQPHPLSAAVESGWDSWFRNPTPFWRGTEVLMFARSQGYTLVDIYIQRHARTGMYVARTRAHTHTVHDDYKVLIDSISHWTFVQLAICALNQEHEAGAWRGCSSEAEILVPKAYPARRHWRIHRKAMPRAGAQKRGGEVQWIWGNDDGWDHEWQELLLSRSGTTLLLGGFKSVVEPTYWSLDLPIFSLLRGTLWLT